MEHEVEDARPWTEVHIWGSREEVRVEIRTNDPMGTGTAQGRVSRRKLTYTAISPTDDAREHAYQKARTVPDSHQLRVFRNSADVTDEVIRSDG